MADRDKPAKIRAAGALLWRPAEQGTEVALVHRPRYDDWSFPKGKSMPGEHVLLTAVREVEEETGLQVRILRPMGCTAYMDRRGRDKVVCYWVMWADGGRFVPNEEADQLRWLTVDEALELLTYRADRALLATQELP